MQNLAIKKTSARVHPKMFALWLGLGSIVMMFAGLTSAFIVRKAVGDWQAFQLPNLFAISTIVIVLSSISLHFAGNAFKNSKWMLYRLFISITLALGIAFVGLQWQGWLALQDIGIRLEGNPSGSFVYVISGMHALHVIGGMLILGFFVIKALIKTVPVKEADYALNNERNLGINLLSTYWHFVGILWIYLFCFFKYFQ